MDKCKRSFNHYDQSNSRKKWCFFCFSFPIYLCGKTRKMKSVFILIDSLFQLYLWIVIINAILGWLVTFNIINTSNRFIYSLIEFSYRLTEPVLRKIRMVLPIIVSIDFSPVVLVLGLIFIRNLIFELFAPYLF